VADEKELSYANDKGLLSRGGQPPNKLIRVSCRKQQGGSSHVETIDGVFQQAASARGIEHSRQEWQGQFRVFRLTPHDR